MGTEHFRGSNGRRPFANKEIKKLPKVVDPSATQSADGGFITLGGLRTFHPGRMENVYVDGLRVKRPARVNHVDGVWVIPIFRQQKKGKGK